MGWLRRIVATIQQQLGKLTLTQRLLMVCLGIIAAMSLFFVVQYAARPGMVPLEGLDGATAGRAATILRASSIEADMRNDGVYVPASQRYAAIAALQQDPDVAMDTRLTFDNLMEHYDWKLSREQNRQQFFLAKQNELSNVIREFRGVRSASVILDVPMEQGLGRAQRVPSASVTVRMTGGAMPQKTVDAVGSLVAGAVAGLDITRVKVIDAFDQRMRRPSGEEELAAATYLEHRAMVEKRIRQKIESHLSYIPGVMVAVTADVDVSRVSEQTKRHLEPENGTVSLPRRETASSLTEQNTSRAAEPGVRSMQGADINESPSSGGSLVEQSEADTEFDNAIGTEVREVVDPRGAPRFLAVTVNIPEWFVRQLAQQDAAAPEDGDGGGQAEADVAGRFDRLREDVERTIRPHIKTRADDGTLSDGELNVAMVPVDGPAMNQAQSAGVFGLIAGDGSGGLVGGVSASTLVVAATALVALGLMIMMVRRSGKKMELPSAEELIGVPPSLQGDQDLFGEAHEGDSPMTGIEVGEDDVRRQGMLKEVGEMIAADPAKTARLMGRWMSMDD